MESYVITSKDGIDPVDYVKSYFTHLSDREINVLVGSIGLMGEVPYSVLQSVLNLEPIDVEEKIGRLMQSDLLEGRFTDNSFILDKFNYPLLKQTPNLVLDDRILLAYLKARFEITLDEIQKTFDLSYPATIYLLATFTAKGLISPQPIENSKYQFIVHFRYPKRRSAEITDLEKEIVGYGMLKGKLTIKQMAHDLEEPEHKVLSTLTTLILSDLITVNFEFSQKKIGGINLFVEIDRFQIKFNRRAIQVLSDQERLLVGFVSLRREVSFLEIQNLANYSESTIIKIAAQLVATNQFQLFLRGNKILYVKEVRPFPFNRSLETLTAINAFDYRLLIGIVKTQKEISIREISKKMKVSPEDVVLALITCYLEGILVGTLTHRYIFKLNVVRKAPKGSELTLEPWEKVLLGALISEKKLTWPKIAALLGVDRTTARNRAFSFMSRGIAKTQAKDTVIMVEETPTVPPLGQLSELTIEEQEIFGYIMAFETPSVRQLRSLFDLKQIEALRIIYFLSGFGLASIKRKQGLILVDSQPTIEPVKSVSELEFQYQEVIKYVQKVEENRISINKIAKALEFPKNQVIRNLCYIIAHGYFKGTLTPSRFIRKSSLLTSHLVMNCLFCEHELDNIDESCSNCDKLQPICGVCKGVLNIADQLVSCPHCENLSHSLHMRQWLKIKGECPFCRNPVRENQLQIYQPLL